MNAVVYYSNTGESRAVAEYLSEQLDFLLVNMEQCTKTDFENLVLVFPVHCQNAPKPVIRFLRKTTCQNLTVIATYGKMCCGNVLHELQKSTKKSIVAAAYLPAKHTYLPNDSRFSDFECLDPLIQKIKAPSAVKLPKLYKNPLADLFPSWRSRVGVWLRKTDFCSNCGTCSEKCPMGAMQNGIPSRKCVRCLRCVESCPNHALQVGIRRPLQIYLNKKKNDKIIIYI